MAIVDLNGYILSPMTVESVNRHDTTLLPKSLHHLSKLRKSIGLSSREPFLTWMLGLIKNQS